MNSSALFDKAGMRWYIRKYQVLYNIRQPIINSIYAALFFKVSRQKPCVIHRYGKPPDAQIEKDILGQATAVLADEENEVNSNSHIIAFTSLNGTTVLYPALNISTSDLDIPQR